MPQKLFLYNCQKPRSFIGLTKTISTQNSINTSKFHSEIGAIAVPRLYGCSEQETYITRETVRNIGRVFRLIQIEIKVIVISKID